MRDKEYEPTVIDPFDLFADPFGSSGGPSLLHGDTKTTVVHCSQLFDSSKTLEKITLHYSGETNEPYYVEFTIKDLEAFSKVHKIVDIKTCLWDASSIIIPINNKISARYTPMSDKWEVGSDSKVEQRFAAEERKRVAEKLYEYLERMGL